MQKARRPKKFISLLFYSLVIIGSVFTISKWLSKPVEAAWYDDSWQYRTKIVITNTGAAVANQKVKLDIATDSLITAGKIQADCGDSRFVSSTGEILRYYLDTAGGACNTASTDYYVLIPSINAGSVVLYHYYGNPGIVNGTEGANFNESTFTPNSSSTATEEIGTSPIGYWKFDEGVNNTCDEGANDVCNAGSVGKTGDLIFSDTTPPSWTNSGKYGKAANFDGSNDFGVVTDGSWMQFGTGDFATSAWVYPETTVYGALNSGVIISKNYTAYEMGIYQGGLVIYLGGTSYNCGPTNLTPNKWYHLAFTRISGVARGYVNGVELCNVNNSSNITNASQDMYVGVRPGTAGSYLDGYIDELKLYNFGLTADQVKLDYNRGSAIVLGTEDTGAKLADGAGNAPVAEWKFDEKDGNSALDTSGNARTGSWQGTAPYWTLGKFGSAGKFNGSNNYVSISGDLTGTGNFSASAWVNPNAIDARFLNDVNGGVGTRTWFISIESDGKFGAWLATSGSITGVLKSTTTPVLGNWYFVEVTYSSTTWSLYVNGKLENSASKTAFNWSDPRPAAIGAYADLGTFFFNGKIDQVRIYNYARTPAQVAFDYDRGAPVGWWNFDEGADNTCVGGTNDVCNSGNSNTNIDGAVSGTAVPATSTSGWTTSGKFNKALNFDGTNDYVAVGTQSSLDVIAGDFTVSSWVKTAQTGSTKWILQKGSGNLIASDKGYSLYLGTSGTKWTFGVWDGTTGHDITPSTTQGVDTTNWHHIVGVFVASTKTAYLYVDGILASQATNSSYSTPSISANNFNIGATGAAGSSWSGGIDEVKVYNYALSSAEVKLNYNRGAVLVLGAEDTGAKTTGGAGSVPLAYWNLNEKTGLSAFDKSGTGINGTLEGGAKWTSGKFGSGIYFDGVDDRVNMGDVTTFDSQTGLSISLWTKISTLATARRLVSKWTSSQSSFMISLDDTSSDELIMAVSDGVHYDVFSTTAANLTTNRWYHIEMTWTDTTRAIYVNGVSMALSTALDQGITGTNNSTEPLQIGDSGETTPFNGFIDEVKIYNYARSQGLVAYDYNRGAPAGQWTLDDCQGTTAADSAPNSNGDFNGHNGTISIGGTGTYTSAGSCNSGTSTEAWNGGTTGKINSALGFDGTNDYVEIAYAASLAPSVNISFGGWFYTADKTQTSQSILSKTQGGGYNLFLNNTGGACGSTTSLCGLVNVSSSYYAVDYPVSNLSNNTWYHAMVTFNGTTVKLYLNGQLVDSKPASGVVTYTVSNALCIGAEPGNTVCDAGSPFNGKLDDIRIYNYDLSSTQIKEVYNRGSIYFGPATGTP